MATSLGGQEMRMAGPLLLPGEVVWFPLLLLVLLGAAPSCLSCLNFFNKFMMIAMSE